MSPNPNAFKCSHTVCTWTRRRRRRGRRPCLSDSQSIYVYDLRATTDNIVVQQTHTHANTRITNYKYIHKPSPSTVHGMRTSAPIKYVFDQGVTTCWRARCEAATDAAATNAATATATAHTTCLFVAFSMFERRKRVAVCVFKSRSAIKRARQLVCHAGFTTVCVCVCVFRVICICSCASVRRFIDTY